MAIDVRTVLKNKLPHTLPPSSAAQPSPSVNPHIQWDCFDPETQDKYPVTSKSDMQNHGALDEISASLAPPLQLEDFNRPWDNYSDDIAPIDARDIDFEELCAPPSERPPRIQGSGGWGGVGRVVETCAFYMPFHFHDDWGIHIKEHCLLSLQKEIAHILSRWCQYHCRVRSVADVNRIRAAVGVTALRLATLRYYLHEVYHHKVEAFATRCEAITGAAVYLPGFHHHHLSFSGAPEEPFAEADMLLKTANSTRATWTKWENIIRPLYDPSIPSSRNLIKELRGVVMRFLRSVVYHRTPDPYCRGARITAKTKFDAFQNRWRQGVLSSLRIPSLGLELANHMDAPYLRQDSTGFWIIVDKGRPRPHWLSLIGTL